MKCSRFCAIQILFDKQERHNHHYSLQNELDVLMVIFSSQNSETEVVLHIPF